MKDKKTILIIEDDAFLVDAYKVKLSGMPWKVITAANGNVGYEMAIEQRPNLIILDLLIEGITGLEVLKRIRDNSQIKDTPVVVATNVNQDETALQAKKLGANDYFIKSDISIADLIDKCKQYL